MRYAVSVPNFAEYGDVRTVAALAADAEAAGWDGFFVWDHLTFVKRRRLAIDDPAAARAVVEPLAAAGMTWWTESLEPQRGGLEELRTRVRQGPPGR